VSTDPAGDPAGCIVVSIGAPIDPREAGGFAGGGIVPRTCVSDQRGPTWARTSRSILDGVLVHGACFAAQR
jgi:hypothetical protein